MHASRDTSIDVFARFLEVLLPHGGHAVTLVECFFDESVGHDVPLLCVAGYVIESRKAKRLTNQWRRVLKWKKLPYFRMSACAHGNAPFDKIKPEERVMVEKRMIAAIKDFTIQGFAATVNTVEYEQFMPKHVLIGSAYTFCAHMVIGAIEHWVTVTEYDGDIAYFFESGHRSQAEANAIMRLIFKEPELKIATRYAGHAFVDKVKTPAVQAADLLAWQWYKDKKNQMEGRARRKDCASLIEHPHSAVHLTPAMMMELAQKWGFNEQDPETTLRRLHLGDKPT